MPHTRVNGELIDNASIPPEKLTFTPGDMTKEAYDSTDNGKVDHAELADAVAWSGVSGKPTSFPSNEADVAVEETRFDNFTPAESTLEATLDAIDAAFTALPEVSIVKSTIILTAAGGAPTTNAGCAGPTHLEGVTNHVDYWALEFDASSSESAFWNIQLPDRYNGGAFRFRFVWTNASGGAAETVTFKLSGRVFGDNETLDQAFGTEISLTDIWQAQNKSHISADSADVTFAGTPTGGKYAVVKVTRDTADTLTGDARLLAIQLEYTTNGPTD